mgnify:CR=1 FL=1
MVAFILISLLNIFCVALAYFYSSAKAKYDKQDHDYNVYVAGWRSSNYISNAENLIFVCKIPFLQSNCCIIYRHSQQAQKTG